MKIRACKKSEVQRQTQGGLFCWDTMFPNKVSGDNFEEEVLKNSLPVIVVFYTTWCAPCKYIAPRVRLFHEFHRDKIKVCSVNPDEESSLASTYGIRGIPAFIIFHQGKIVDSFIGGDEGLFEREMKKIFKRGTS